MQNMKCIVFIANTCGNQKAASTQQYVGPQNLIDNSMLAMPLSTSATLSWKARRSKHYIQ
jgi:hypothetical protein